MSIILLQSYTEFDAYGLGLVRATWREASANTCTQCTCNRDIALDILPPSMNKSKTHTPKYISHFPCLQPISAHSILHTCICSTIIREIFVLKMFMCKISGLKIFTVLGRLRKCNYLLRVWKANMEELRRPCCIRGYHVYSAVWEAAIGEELACYNTGDIVSFDNLRLKYFLLKIFRV